MKLALIGHTTSSILNFRKEFILALVKQGDEVYVFADDYSEKTKAEIKQLGAIPVDYLIKATSFNIFFDIVYVCKLYALLKAINPDIVFCYYFKPIILGAVAAKLAATPRIIALIEGLGFAFVPLNSKHYSWKRRVIRNAQIILYKIILPLVDKCLFLNADDVQDVIEKYKAKPKSYFMLGPIGLNLQSYPYSPIQLDDTDTIRFIFIGRLLRDKGIYEYIEAANAVKNSYPNTEFLVLGGKPRNSLAGITEEELKELADHKVISYHGQVDNVYEWLAHSHILVLPSYYREGFSRVIQEAMSIGRAVITTDRPGCKDAIEYGKNGFTFSIQKPSTMIEKMIFFIENREQVVKMGDAAHQYAKKHFDCKKINKKLIELIVQEQCKIELLDSSS